MHTRTKCVLAALAATLVLAFAVNSASAVDLHFSSTNFRIVWTGLRFFDNEGLPNTECPVTMEGSFHESTIQKIRGELIGFITRAVTNEGRCTNGPSHFVLVSLPWHLTYQGFSGRLPLIERIRVLVRGVAYENVIEGVACTFTENGVESLSGEFAVAAGVLTTFEFDPATKIARSGGALCFQALAGLRNAGTVTVLGATTRITVTLI